MAICIFSLVVSILSLKLNSCLMFHVKKQNIELHHTWLSTNMESYNEQ